MAPSFMVSKLNSSTKEWFKSAEQDLKTVIILSKAKGPQPQICFHCQQAAEKYLKGYLILNKIQFRKVHDLVELLKQCEKVNQNFSEIMTCCQSLNIYAVSARYPDEVDAISLKETKDAVHCMLKITAFIKKEI